jgi:hypothetical protein
MPLHLPDDEKLALMTLLMRTTPRIFTGCRREFAP